MGGKKKTKRASNNKGFTLVELIITIAVSSFVILSITVLLTTSVRTYGSLHSTINLQYNSQIVTTQIQERVLDCNGGIAFDDAENVLYVVNINDDGTKVLYVYRLADGDMMYGEKTSATTGTDDDIIVFAQDLSTNATDLMSRDILDFDVEAQVENGEVISAVIILDYLDEGNEYSVKQTISLRNSPLFKDNLPDLITGLNED